MSCQQASRFITNNSTISPNSNKNINCDNHRNTHQHQQQQQQQPQHQADDPYVFTETVPTLPPAFFNTQKSRVRLIEVNPSTSITTNTTTTTIAKFTTNQLHHHKQQQQANTTLINVCNNNNNKNAEALAAVALASPNVAEVRGGEPLVIDTNANTNTNITTSTIAAALVGTVSNNKKQQQPQQQQQQQKTTTITATSAQLQNGNKKLTNVCIVRPQKQQQQQHQHQQQQQQQENELYCNGSLAVEDIKSLSPSAAALSPLYTPTPSLWQTPLLLEPIQIPAITQQSAAVPSCCSPPTLNICTTIQSCGGNGLNGNGVNTTTINATTTTTTAMAKVAPIVVHTVPPTNVHTTKLPPSKFHQHTMAQQLKKVEILKKPSFKANAQPPPLQVFDGVMPMKHSTSGENLNDIPVNVIFRMAVVSPGQMASDSMKDGQKPLTTTTPSLLTPPSLPQPIPAPEPAPTAPDTCLNNRNVEYSLPASNDVSLNTAVSSNNNNNTTSSIESIDQNKIKTIQNNLLLEQNEHQLKDLGNHAINNNNNVKCKALPDKIQTHKTANILTTCSSSGGHTVPTPPPPPPPSLPLQKKPRKSILNLDYPTWQVGSTLKGAVAVVKMSQSEVTNDNSLMASPANLPYCLQRNWLSHDIFIEAATSTTALAAKPIMSREERVIMHKQQLRRQAEQLLSVRRLQKLPLQLAKKRLLCVKRLLHKYDQQKRNGPLNRLKRCCIAGCDAWCIEMASHCQKHIVQNATQQIFTPCTAKFANNSPCKTPVFDVTHDLPLCMEHARKRDAYNRFLNEQKPHRISPATVLMPEPQARQSKQQQQQQQQHMLYGNSIQAAVLPTHISTTITTTTTSKTPIPARKRKLNAMNPIGRPQKRSKKAQATAAVIANKSIPLSSSSSSAFTQLPPLSTVLKRKSSTTSLESITSNSYQSSCSSSSSSSASSTFMNLAQITNNGLEQILAPPALVPLSGAGCNVKNNISPQHLLNYSLESNHNNNNNNNYKHSYHHHHHHHHHHHSEITDLVNQYTLAGHHHQQQQQLNFNFNTNSNSNFTSSGMGSTTSLPNGDDFLTQDMLSICENSSASSEDTGLGGLSDPELMLSAGTDADDIPLGDAPLLEEHDLDNVLSSLPEDTFKELFATVHQDESDEIERAIEIADKNLKTLQQTIGSSLGDFLNFNDDILSDTSDFVNGTAGCVPSLMDTSTLFMDGSISGIVGGGNGSSNGCSGSGLPEFRGLVQA